MLIGVPKEIKNQEYRVGLTPAGVKELCRNGHKVVIETDAGSGVSLTDEMYRDAGAEIAKTAEDVFDTAKLIVKVKEPQPNECRQLKEDQMLFTFLHLAPDPIQTDLLVKAKCTAIAYETVTDNQGSLPLLTPMSEVAGRIAIQAGAHCLEKAQGGNGMLLGGVPGVQAANVIVLGGGVVGLNAARMAAGLGAHVTILDRSVPRLKVIDELFGDKMQTLYSTTHAIECLLEHADLVVGAVLIPGASAPKLISRDMLSGMQEGSVMVDVAIDQGGCFETSKPTTHDQPTYQVDGVVHYCVANMPGAAARTSTFALTNVTLPYVLQLADKNVSALLDDHNFLQGLNVHKGQITNKPVATSLDYDFMPPKDALVNLPFGV